MKKIIIALLFIICFCSSAHALSFGTPSQFASTAEFAVRTVSLTSTTIVAIEGWTKTAKVGTISGTSISWGDASTAFASTAEHITMSAVSTSKFVVSYRTTGNIGYAIVGAVSGTTITWGTANAVSGTKMIYANSVSGLSSTKFIVGYTNEDNFKGRVGVIDGSNNISFGTEADIISTYDPVQFNLSTVALDSTHFAMCGRGDSFNHLYAVAGVIDGSNNITVGTPSEVVANDSAYNSLIKIDATHFLACYQAVTTKYGTAVVVTVDGSNNISFGTPAQFEGAEATYLSGCSLSSTIFAIAYTDVGNSDYGTANILTVSGTGVSAGTPVVFYSGATALISAASLDSNSFAVAHRGSGGSVAIGLLNYPHKIYGVTPVKVNGVTPVKINGI